MKLTETAYSTVGNRRRSAWILATAATVLINASGLCQQAGIPVLEDESRLWEEFKAQVRALVDTENFTEVDKLADELRRTRARWSGGTLKLEFLYTAYQRTLRSEDEWQRHFSRLNRWVENNPNSVAARILLGEAYTSYAWVARGTGFADTVTDDGRKLFEERLQKAREVLEAAGRLSTKDAAVYWILGRVALGQSWPRDQLEAIFQKGIAVEPDWYQMYFVKAYYLLPRWHGEPGEWVKFAEQAAEMTRREQGESLYARIVWFMMNAVGGTLEFKMDEGFFARNGISWPKLKQGFIDIEKRHPGSLRTVNTFCQFACLAGDAETARSLFARLGDRWDADVWAVRGRFEKWRAWSDPPTPRVRIAANATLQHQGSSSDGVASIAYSPDGRTLAAANWGGAVVLWDVNAQKVKAELRELPGSCRRVRFSPDGRLLAATTTNDRDSSDPGEIRIWESASEKEVVRLNTQKNPAYGLAFLPDGKTLITGGGQPNKAGEVILWDLTGFKGLPLELNMNRIVRSIAVSPNGHLLAYAYGQCAAVWNLKNNQSVFRKLLPNANGQNTHAKLVFGLAFSPDGQVLASADDSGAVRLWSCVTGELLPISIKGHIDRVSGIAFSPDGKTLATCSYDETARLWDVSTGQERLNIVGHHDRIHDVAFSPDGRVLATASGDGTVRLWDLSSVPAAAPIPAVAQQAPIPVAPTSVVASPAPPAVPRPPAAITDLRYSADAKSLAVALRGGDVILWDTSLQKERTRITGLPCDARRVAFAPNGRWLAVAARAFGDETQRGEVRIVDTFTMKELARLAGYTEPVWSVNFASDGRTLVTAGGRRNTCGEIYQWDLTTFRGKRLDYQFKRLVSDIALSPDGKHWAFPQSHWVMLWDVAGRKFTNHSFRDRLHTNACLRFAFSPDGRTLASGDVAGAIRLSSVPNGQPLTVQVGGHTEQVSGLEFSRDGQLLASASWDQSIRLWSLLTGREVARLTGHGGRVPCIALSPDKSKLVFAGEDGVVRVWNLRLALAGKQNDASVVILPVQ